MHIYLRTFCTNDNHHYDCELAHVELTSAKLRQICRRLELAAHLRDGSLGESVSDLSSLHFWDDDATFLGADAEAEEILGSEDLARQVADDGYAVVAEEADTDESDVVDTEYGEMVIAGSGSSVSWRADPSGASDSMFTEALTAEYIRKLAAEVAHV